MFSVDQSHRLKLLKCEQTRNFAGRVYENVVLSQRTVKEKRIHTVLSTDMKKVDKRFGSFKIQLVIGLMCSLFETTNGVPKVEQIGDEDGIS